MFLAYGTYIRFNGVIRVCRYVIERVADCVTDEVPGGARRPLLLSHVVTEREQSEAVLQETAH